MTKNACSASGLGRATCLNLGQAGGYVAVLDLSEDRGMEVVMQLGPNRAKFFQVDVRVAESITSVVADVLVWTKSTGKEIGGVVAAAGFGNPAKVRFCFALVCSSTIAFKTLGNLFKKGELIFLYRSSTEMASLLVWNPSIV